jgi:C-terminal processing protease CtpA/Prc
MWAPDSRRIVYVSERDDVNHIFMYDFTANAETQLTNDVKGDDAPKFSPDGHKLAFVRDDKQVVVMDLASKQERVVASGFISASPRNLQWSSDNQWVAYLGLSTRSFRNAHLVPAAGGESRAVSAIPNANTNVLSWSPDGTFLVFNSSQRTEDTSVVRVDLTLRTPKFAEDQFRDLFRDEPGRTGGPGTAGGRGGAPAAGGGRGADAKPIEIDFNDIRRRMSILNLGTNYSAEAISPDGRWLLANGGGNLYVYPLDAPAGGGGGRGGGAGGGQTRQLTTSPGGKSNAQFTSDSREVFYLEGGRINVVNVESRQSRAVNVTAELDVDFSKEKMEVFRQAWTYMRDRFYDEKFHGADWGEVRAQFTPIVAGVRTPDELRRVLNLMMGELNASHLGASGAGPAGSQASNNGRLGLMFDRSEYESGGRLKVTSVLPLGPAAISKQIKAGDYILAVNGANVGATTNLDEELMHQVGKRVELRVASTPAGADARTVVVQPITGGAERTLLYRDWIESNRAYVDKVSNGRLGYVHIRDMSENALRQLALDLDADNRAKAGVVVDVRHNNGGFVNVYAIDVLARRGYLTMTPRGLPASPARTSLGQRSLELPTILVTNQHSLSDAEDFTEGYKQLKLGKVVGEPTSGWIIFTGSATLIDGTSIRMPSTRITSNDGKTMELNPRQVDVPVTRPIGETYTGKDSQLETAVRELLKQIGGGRP